VTGLVSFTQMNDGVKVIVRLSGLAPNTTHGFHIHEKGDLSDPALASAGAHFNPKGHKHGGPQSAMAHAGDLGNVTSDANGNVKVNQIQQDGFPAGSLQTVSIGQNGRVVGNYSNGRNIDLAQISVATFNGTNFLKRIDGGAFEATDQSGQALFGSGGTIVGSSLENSNTDIADEFTKLIVTQQAYSANTKVITTSNSMVQDLLNVLR
jgi:flagellar hook-basal body protein